MIVIQQVQLSPKSWQMKCHICKKIKKNKVIVEQTTMITIIMKRKLNSDGQQFPQYQQNEQLIIPSKH
jgi:hypothetical protein